MGYLNLSGNKSSMTVTWPSVAFSIFSASLGPGEFSPLSILYKWAREIPRSLQNCALLLLLASSHSFSFISSTCCINVNTLFVIFSSVSFYVAVNVMMCHNIGNTLRQGGSNEAI